MIFYVIMYDNPLLYWGIKYLKNIQFFCFGFIDKYTVSAKLIESNEVTAVFFTCYNQQRKRSSLTS